MSCPSFPSARVRLGGVICSEEASGANVVSCEHIFKLRECIPGTCTEYLTDHCSFLAGKKSLFLCLLSKSVGHKVFAGATSSASNPTDFTRLWSLSIQPSSPKPVSDRNDALTDAGLFSPLRPSFCNPRILLNVLRGGYNYAHSWH